MSWFYADAQFKLISKENSYIESKPRNRHGCLIAVLIELFLVVVVIAIAIIRAAKSYDGRCIKWDGALPNETCTLGEFLIPAMVCICYLPF